MGAGKPQSHARCIKPVTHAASSGICQAASSGRRGKPNETRSAIGEQSAEEEVNQWPS